jgi:hypothetical protein
VTPVYKLSANSVKNGRTVYGSMLAGNPVYEPPGDFQSIATVTVGSGGSSSITFSSIPATYAHLQIRAIAKAAPTATDIGYDLRLAMNSDTTGSNYECHYLFGNGSGAGAGANTDNRIIGAAAGSGNANMFAVNIYDILDYTNTNKYKVVRALGADDFNGSGYMIMYSMLWMNTNAITSLTFDFHTGPSFGQYSQFALYGIKGA